MNILISSHKRQLTLIGMICLFFVAHAILLSGFPLLWQAVAALLLSAWLPGILFVEWLLAQSSIARWERMLYAIGAGYCIMVVVMLLLSYLPGTVSRWQTLLAFDVIVLVLGLLCYRTLSDHKPQRQALAIPHQSVWFWAGLLSLLLVAGFFRLIYLDYSEFQGDEARAALRAAAVIQGYEDVLFIHKKGPTEILLPTVIYALTGYLNEQIARLPFALANLTALLALFLLGWRLIGPIAGWTAAMLLALDGYLIAFARIVQYQSIVFLMSVLVVLLLQRLEQGLREKRRKQGLREKKELREKRQEQGLRERTAEQALHLNKKESQALLLLGSLFLATGLLSHYEAIFALIPALYLLSLPLLSQLTSQKRAYSLFPLILAPYPLFLSILALLPGLIILTLFYLPFILHPNFSDTFTYLAQRRIGGSFPYNNLADFFIRSTLYNTTYYALLMICLTMAALWQAYRRGLRRLGAVIGSLAIFGLLLTLWDTSWLRIAQTDLMVVLFGVVLVGLWFMPRLSAYERMLWLWFGVPMLMAFFFTEKPRTHVYVFFIPWALLAGMMVERGVERLKKEFGDRIALMTALGLTTVGVLLFGSYAYWFFIHHDVQVLRTWQENRPAGFWTVYDEPDTRGIFGFPFANGWKEVGLLYQEGLLSGNYSTNEHDSWIPAWYTRGQVRCDADAEWFFQAAHLDEFGQTADYRETIKRYLSEGGFQEWEQIELNGLPYMTIHQRSQRALTPNPSPNLGRGGANFDQYSSADFPLNHPVVLEPKISHPLHTNLDNQLWLEGYDLRYDAPLKPGDSFQLLLYWRAQAPISHNYKVFNQLYSGDSGMQAQLDRYPLCGGSDTSTWTQGELLTDSYHIQIKADAKPGVYGLYSGMYREETGERLMVRDEADNIVDSQVYLTDIKIGDISR